MIELEHLWPDPDRRDEALFRVAVAIGRAHERTHLTPMEVRVLEALSHGLGREGAAEVLGVTVETVKSWTLQARRVLRAKNTTHACCEALRQGLIR